MAVSTLRAPGGQWSRSSTGTRLPAYRQTGDAAIRSRPRTVIRSAAPGPAPMKCTVTWSRSRWLPAWRGASRSCRRSARRAGPRCGSGRRRAAAYHWAIRASVSSVTAFDDQATARAAARPSRRRPCRRRSLPPPMNTASGDSRPSSAAGRRSRLRPRTAARQRGRVAFEPLGAVGVAFDGDRAAGRVMPGTTRSRCCPRRRRRPRAAARAPGRGGDRVTARTSRLVSWPSFSYASSGRPGAVERTAGRRAGRVRR